MVNPIVPDSSLNNSGQTNSRVDNHRALDISRKSGHTPNQQPIDEEDSDGGIKSVRHSKHNGSDNEDDIAQNFGMRQPYRPNKGASSGKDQESPDMQNH